MKKSIIALLSISCFAAGVLSPRHGLAAPPAASDEASTRAVALEVDISAVGEHAQGLDEKIRETLQPKLEEANFGLVDDAPLVLRVRLRTLESGPRDYGVHFEFVEADGSVDMAIEWVDCSFCADARLLPLLEAQAPALIDAIEERAKATAQAANGNDDGSAVVDDRPEVRPVKPLGPLGHAGIGVTVLGLGATIVGAVELSRGRVYDSPGDGYDLSGTDHRPPGYALVGVGAAATVAGLVILGVDAGRRAKQRKQSTTSRALIIPSITPSGVGVGVIGRF